MKLPSVVFDFLCQLLSVYNASLLITHLCNTKVIAVCKH